MNESRIEAEVKVEPADETSHDAEMDRFIITRHNRASESVARTEAKEDAVKQEPSK